MLLLNFSGERDRYFAIIIAACLPNTYGWNCNMTCGNCLDRGHCDHKNGTCLMGCDPGWQGDMCVDGIVLLV